MKLITTTTAPPPITQYFNPYLLLGPWLNYEETRLKCSKKASRRYALGSKKSRRFAKLEEQLEKCYDQTTTKKEVFKKAAKERSDVADD